MIPNLNAGRDALHRLDEFLAEHAQIEVHREAGSTTVRGTPETGFDVTMVDWGREAMIEGGGWHGHFDDPEEAASTFMWLLTPSTRIVLTFRGAQHVGWRLEWEEEGKWVRGERGASLAALFLWGKRREETLQNDLLGPRIVQLPVR